jgi:acyl-CoA synthetase (NDP forming)
MTAETLLINENHIRKYTSVNDAVDVNLMRTAIYLAQDKYLENYLGTELVKRLKLEVNNLIADPAYIVPAEYLTLLEDYVAKALVWWAMVELYPDLAYKHDNGNIVRKLSEDTETISQGQLGQLMERARSNAKHYTQILIDYVRINVSLYPEYNTNSKPDKHPSQQVSTTTGMVFSGGYNSPKWRIEDVKSPS